jgi:ectoine hydroxylase-related dioxygenase (phytanoyl-CoA dioxygenase family)
MFPDQLISVMIALTAANKQNRCLQVIRGSYKLGRVNHGLPARMLPQLWMDKFIIPFQFFLSAGYRYSLVQFF